MRRLPDTLLKEIQDFLPPESVAAFSATSREHGVVSCDGMSPLYFALTNARYDVATFLIEQGANVNAVDPDTASTLLHTLVKQGFLDAVAYLVRQGAKVDALDNDYATPFCLAVDSGNERAVEIFSEKMYEKVQQGRVGDKSWKICGLNLIRAVELDLPCIAKQLIAIGAAVDYSDVSCNYWTPLQLAADAGNAFMVEVLLEYGADVDKALPQTKMTALHLSILNGHAEVVSLLLGKGADRTKQMSDGVTAAQLAENDPNIKPLFKAKNTKKQKATKQKHGLLFSGATNKKRIIEPGSPRQGL